MKYQRRLGLVFVGPLLGLGGCASTAELQVVRPATVENLSLPTKVSLQGPWTGSAEYSAKLRALLTAALREAPGKLLVVDDAAPLRLSGSVEVLAPEETTPSTLTTCSDYSTDQPKHYPCTVFRRVTTAHVRVTVVLTDGVGQPLYRLALPLSATQRTIATVPQEQVSASSAAPNTDLGKLQTDLLVDATARLLKALTPHREIVKKPKLDCGLEKEACNQAWENLASCHYDVAHEKFSRALLRTPESDAKRAPERAAVLWGLALTQELKGSFAEARVSLKAAQALDPKQEAFGRELSELESAEVSALRVKAQGAAELSACE